MRKWTRTYDGAAHGGDTAAALGVDKYGNVTVVGSSKGAHGQDYVVIKWASNGTRKFVWHYDGAGHADDAATDVRVESGGTTYVTGNIKTAALKDATYTVKFSSSGSKVWGKPYLGPSSLGANATSIAARPAGGVYIAGWSLDAVTGMDAMVARYTSSGSGQVLPPPSLVGDDSFADLAVTSNKIVVGVGSYTVGANVQSMWLRWGSETAPPVGNPYGGGFADAFTACTADSSGGVYYTGYERTAVNQSQIRTNRTSFLDMSSGFESLWGPALGADTSTGIAASGTVVYVVGTTYKDAIEAYNQVVLIYVY